MGKRINWFHFAMFVVLFCGLGWVIHVIRTEVTELGDLVGLGIVGVLCLIFGVFSFIMTFFEDRLLKFMYGDFSNRNPWGR